MIYYYYYNSMKYIYKLLMYEYSIDMWYCIKQVPFFDSCILSSIHSGILRGCLSQMIIVMSACSSSCI